MYPKLLYAYLGQDDPRKSTMKKLERFGMVIKVPVTKASRTLSLTPYADLYLLPSDRELALKTGLLLIDGSWNRIASIENLRLRYPRKLPLLVPVNPVNFGNHSAIKTPCPHCGNASFNRILEAKERFDMVTKVPVTKASRTLSLTPYADFYLLQSDRGLALKTGNNPVCKGHDPFPETLSLRKFFIDLEQQLQGHAVQAVASRTCCLYSRACFTKCR